MLKNKSSIMPWEKWKKYELTLKKYIEILVKENIILK